MITAWFGGDLRGKCEACGEWRPIDDFPPGSDACCTQYSAPRPAAPAPPQGPAPASITRVCKGCKKALPIADFPLSNRVANRGEPCQRCHSCCERLRSVGKRWRRKKITLRVFVNPDSSQKEMARLKRRYEDEIQYAWMQDRYAFDAIRLKRALQLPEVQRMIARAYRPNPEDERPDPLMDYSSLIYESALMRGRTDPFMYLYYQEHGTTEDLQDPDQHAP